MRYRSLGCYPYTHAVDSDAWNVDDIIVEPRTGKFANIAERSGRAQDKADGGGLETLLRDGYLLAPTSGQRLHEGHGGNEPMTKPTIA